MALHTTPSRAIAACWLLVCTPLAATAQRAGEATIEPYLWQAGMAPSEVGVINVFRRFGAARTDAMQTFYGEVLGLEALPQTAPGGGQMIRYPVGDSEVKLFPIDGREPNTSAVNEATGVRLLTLFFADEAALGARFAEHGLARPAFTAHADGTRHALVQDPDGHWVELVVVPGAAEAELERFEIGITAADLGQSRAFYSEVMGLAEHGPVRDRTVGAEKYTYRHGTTSINLWTFGPGLPVDGDTAGMQYIVWDVAAVNGVAEARGAPIDRPLSPPGQMRTVWLLDPDNVSNYFAQYAGNDNTPAK